MGSSRSPPRERVNIESERYRSDRRDDDDRNYVRDRDGRDRDYDRRDSHDRRDRSRERSSRDNVRDNNNNNGRDDRRDRSDRGDRGGERDYYRFDRRKQPGDNEADWHQNETFLEYRRRKRETTIGSPVWASSPSPPASPKRKSKRESEKEKERAREREKERDREKEREREKEKQKEREREKERDTKSRDREDRETRGSGDKAIDTERSKDKKKKRYSSSSDSSSESSASASSSDSDRKRKSKRKKDKKKKDKKRKSKKSKRSKDSDSESEEEMIPSILWTEKKADPNDVPVGPRPLPTLQTSHTDYGTDMLPGEAEAIAQFVKDNKRIPRRGEVGLTSDEIEHYEDVGFVMSGSRHKRMTAVRIRKENQVYSAEEKKALAVFNYEEKARRETNILAEFREMLSTKLGEVNNPTK